MNHIVEDLGRQLRKQVQSTVVQMISLAKMELKTQEEIDEAVVFMGAKACTTLFATMGAGFCKDPMSPPNPVMIGVLAGLYVLRGPDVDLCQLVQEAEQLMKQFPELEKEHLDKCAEGNKNPAIQAALKRLEEFKKRAGRSFN